RQPELEPESQGAQLERPVGRSLAHSPGSLAEGRDPLTRRQRDGAHRDARHRRSLAALDGAATYAAHRRVPAAVATGDAAPSRREKQWSWMTRFLSTSSPSGTMVGGLTVRERGHGRVGVSPETSGGRQEAE